MIWERGRCQKKKESLLSPQPLCVSLHITILEPGTGYPVKANKRKPWLSERGLAYYDDPCFHQLRVHYQLSFLEYLIHEVAIGTVNQLLMHFNVQVKLGHENASLFPTIVYFDITK